MEILKFSEPPKRNRRSGSTKKSGLMPLVSFGIAVLVLGGMSTTLAGTITLNSSGSVEFGQGVVTTAACDTTLSVSPTSSYDTQTGFYVSGFTVYDIGVGANETGTANGGCLGKTFKITAVGDTSTITIYSGTDNTKSSSSISFKLPSLIDSATATVGFTKDPSSANSSGGATLADNYSLTSSNSWTALNGTNGTTSSGKITISGLKISATVQKFTIESS